MNLRAQVLITVIFRKKKIFISLIHFVKWMFPKQCLCKCLVRTQGAMLFINSPVVFKAVSIFSV
jgi:hypothetical protein